jgi:hypothetical protein
MRRVRSWLVAALMAASGTLAGCDSNVGRGATIGAAGGAGLGALGPGSVLGNAAAGAAIGGGAGYIYDQVKDDD